MAALSTYVAVLTMAMPSRLAHALNRKFEDGLVRNDGWFLVFTAVILGLGATLLAGMAVWCVVYQGKTFTGRWEFRNFGLNVYFECS